MSNTIYDTLILSFKIKSSLLNKIKKEYFLKTSYSFLEKLYNCELFIDVNLKEYFIDWMHQLGITEIKQKYIGRRK